MGTLKVKMLVSQSGPKLSRTTGETYEVDANEAVRLVRKHKAEALDSKAFDAAEKAFDAAEVKEVEAKKNLSTTKLAEAEDQLTELVFDIDDAKANLAEAKEIADKLIRQHSDKAKKIVKLQASVDAEAREKEAKKLAEQAAKEKEALAKVAALKAAERKKASTTKTAKTNASDPKPLSKMNKGELQAEVVKLEGIKAEEIERINKLGNKEIVKKIKAYKVPKTSDNENTGQKKGATPAATTTTKK